MGKKKKTLARDRKKGKNQKAKRVMANDAYERKRIVKRQDNK